MCGIAGIYDRAKSVEPRLVRAMTSHLVHRGPDGAGYHEEDRVCLGMRRLAIVDVSHGNQPLYNETGDVAVVFNGEIYNHSELRSALEREGHHLSSATDGAILPHMYEELGEHFVERLNGIFAVAVWDARAKTLLLARDRFGVKPLYWSNIDGHIAFASELRALLVDPEIPRSLDLDCIDDFLTFRFVPSPGTAYAAVRKVRPATIVTLTSESERERGYWTDAKVSFADTEDRFVERYSAAFEQAVVRQMMSDRPIGVMLSGGVDSGAITAVLAKHSSHVRTFTVGFEDGGDADETTLAEETARMFSTRHESVVISTADYLRRLPESFPLLEEPVGTSSALAVRYVSEMMGATVPVGLSGQGADELMGGYWRYVGTALAAATRPLAPLARAMARAPLRHVGVRVDRGLATLGAREDIDVLMRAYRLFGADEKARLYRPEVQAAVASNDPTRAVERLRRQVAGKGLLDQMMYVDARLWLPDELLMIADKMSMAASVELRVPFLDEDLVALAESIDARVKVKRLHRKYLHKRAMRNWLPDEVVYRKERGWATPMSAWLRRELLPLLRDVLLSEGGVCRQLFREAEMLSMVEDHRTRRRDLTRELFCLLSVGLAVPADSTFAAASGA